MTADRYQRPAADQGALRLHLNENRRGCSPAVVEVLRGLDASQLGSYPDYTRAEAAVAEYLALPSDQTLLTNGLDEGILAVAAWTLGRERDHAPQALGVTPAFDMYAGTTRALAAEFTGLPLGPSHAIPFEALAGAVQERTRVIFLTNPHNPTGLGLPPEMFVAFARRVAPVIVFLDEAYAEFSGRSILDVIAVEELPNLVVGRTFAKAHGLAGLRVGALASARENIGRLRALVPPYSINAVAAAALPAALADRAYRDRYIAESAQSRALVHACCARLGLESWGDAANFVLIDAGPRAADVVEGLRSRGIAVRDRSADPATPGCLRVTTGYVDDTTRLVAALEEVWCAATA